MEDFKSSTSSRTCFLKVLMLSAKSPEHDSTSFSKESTRLSKEFEFSWIQFEAAASSIKSPVMVFSNPAIAKSIVSLAAEIMPSALVVVPEVKSLTMLTIKSKSLSAWLMTFWTMFSALLMTQSCCGKAFWGKYLFIIYLLIKLNY